MTYRIVYAAPAIRALSASLPRPVVDAVVAFIEGPLAANPRRVGKALEAPLDGLHSARRGDYRIIYRIDDDTIVVTVINIGRRSTIYARTTKPSL